VIVQNYNLQTGQRKCPDVGMLNMGTSTFGLDEFVGGFVDGYQSISLVVLVVRAEFWRDEQSRLQPVRRRATARRDYE
jgi:hypothetical protein